MAMYRWPASRLICSAPSSVEIVVICAKRDTLPGWRKQPDILNSFARIAILLLIAQSDVEARLALLHLGQRVRAHRGLHGILHVGNVDAPALGGGAINLEIQIRLADDAEDSQVLDSLHGLHLRLNLFGLLLQCAKVVAVELDRQFALDAGDGFFHVVGNGLRVIPDHAGKL